MIRYIFQTYRSAFSGLRREIWILSLGQFVTSSGMMVMFFLTLYMTRKLGFTVSGAGQVMGVYGIGSLIGAYLGGWFSDRWESLHIQKSGLILSGITYIVMGYIQNHTLFAVFTGIVAVGNGCLFPAINTSIARFLPSDSRAKGYALNRLAVNLGVSIGPVAGGYLAMHNYHSLFWADGLTCLAAAAVYFVMLKRTSTAPVARAENEALPRSPAKDFYFLVFLLMMLLLGMIFIQLFTTFPLYMRNVYGLTENRIGLLMLINTAMIVLFEMVLMEKLKTCRRDRLIAFSFLALGGGFALMPLGRGFLYGGFTVAVWTIGEMISMPLAAALISDRAGEHSQGRYMGLYSLSFSLAWIIGPLAGTGAYRRCGPDLLWFSCGVAGIILLLGGLYIGRRLDTPVNGT